jgi:outer membrane immunogenic protein
MPEVVYSWTGFYLGGVGSYNWQNFTFPDQSITQAMTPAGAMGGVTVGYDYQVAPNWVLGVLGDVQFGHIGVTVPNGGVMTEGATEKLFSTARARVGYLVTPSLLLYGTGGVAIAEIDQNETCPAGASSFSFCGPATRTRPNNAGPYSLTASQTYVGGTAGAGLEWMFARGWSTKVEYLFSDFGSKVFNLGSAPSGVATTPRGITLEQSQVNVGINYKFDWR